jgi:hypothetical protein
MLTFVLFTEKVVASLVMALRVVAVGEVCLSVTVMVCITVMAGFFNERYSYGEHYSNGKHYCNGAECMSAKPTHGDHL